MRKDRKLPTKFDPFDGRSVSIKGDTELAHGLKYVAELYEDSWGDPAHAAMWKAILAEIKTEIAYRANRDPRMPTDQIVT